MAILKYKKEDQILFVLNVLDLTSYYYSGIGFKFAVRDHFPDLQGKVDTDHIDNESIILLNTIEEEPVMMIGLAVSQITSVLLSIQTVYNIDYLNLELDERIWKLAEDFYWELMIDNFPQNDETKRDDDDFDKDNFPLNLEIYIHSLLRICFCLLDVVTDGLVDTDQAYDAFDVPERWKLEPDDLEGYPFIVTILFDLLMDLRYHLNDYYELYYG